MTGQLNVDHGPGSGNGPRGPQVLHRFLDSYHHWAGRFDRVISFIAGALFVLSLLSTLVGVLGREFPDVFSNVAWTIELTILPMLTAILLVVARGFRENTAMAVTLLPARLPERWFQLLTIVNQLLVIGFFFVVVRYGLDVMILNKSQKTPILSLSLFWVYLVVVISGLLILLESVIRLLEAALGRAPRPSDSDADELSSV